jgi:hypothetical protein
MHATAGICMQVGTSVETNFSLQRVQLTLTSCMQGHALTLSLHNSGAAARSMFDTLRKAASLTQQIRDWALLDVPNNHGVDAASLPAWKVLISGDCTTSWCHRTHMSNVCLLGCKHWVPADIQLLVPQAACNTLAHLVAGSSAARQQCMGEGLADEYAWPDVAADVRQVSCMVSCDN